MDERRLPFMAHLEELRRRLFAAALAFAAGVALSGIFSEEIFALLATPLLRAWKSAGLGTPQLHFASPVEPFWVYIKVALYGGLFVSSPLVLHQLWRFVAPGLYAHERRIAIPLTVFSGLFFVGGALFGYLVVFPIGFEFFLGYSKVHLTPLFAKMFNGVATFDLRPTLMMDAYLSLAAKMLLAFGIVFELPLAVFFLAWAGIVTHRGLWRFSRYAAVIIFIAAAVLTPGPDVVSQLLMAAPMLVLYFASIGIALVVTRRRERRQARR